MMTFSKIILLALTVASLSGATTVLTKYLLPESTADIGGRALDGTMALYYYAPGTNPQSTNWVIFMEGGGSCYDKEACQSRAQTKLGSSNNSAHGSTMTIQSGFLDNDDPDFGEAHKVYLPYVSGDVRLGTQNDTFDDWGVYFSGHSNLVHIIDDLKSNVAVAASATNILFTGGSAGGWGVIANAEWLASVFPAATVKAVPVSGLFPTNVALNATWPEFEQNQTHSSGNATFLMDIYQAYNPPSCVTALSSEEVALGWCTIPVLIVNHSMMQFFVLESQFDKHTLQVQNQFPSEEESTERGQEYIALLGDISRFYHEQVENIFSTSCYNHVSGMDVATKADLGTNISDVNAAMVVRDWYFGRNNLSHHIVEARGDDGLPYNPTCITSLEPSGGGGGGVIPQCIQYCAAACVGNAGPAAIVPGSEICSCLYACDLDSCPNDQLIVVENGLDNLCAGDDGGSGSDDAGSGSDPGSCDRLSDLVGPSFQCIRSACEDELNAVAGNQTCENYEAVGTCATNQSSCPLQAEIVTFAECQYAKLACSSAYVLGGLGPVFLSLLVLLKF